MQNVLGIATHSDVLIFTSSYVCHVPTNTSNILFEKKILKRNSNIMLENIKYSIIS